MNYAQNRVIAALVCIAIAIGWYASHPPQSPSQRAAAEYTHQPNYQTQKENPEEAIARYNQWLTIFTGILAGFTAILAVATVGLGAMNFFQLRLARAEFISTHRPKLIVRQFVFMQPLPDQVLKVEFSIINIGDTEATWRYWHAEVALWNGRYWEAPGLDYTHFHAANQKRTASGSNNPIQIQNHGRT